MAKDVVTNSQLYDAIMNIHEKIDEIVEKRITPLELWKAEIMGKMAILVSILVVGLTFITDWVKEKIFKV